MTGKKHTCALCGRGAEEANLGCLILYETENGTDAWFHRLCADSLVVPKLQPKGSASETVGRCPPR